MSYRTTGPTGGSGLKITTTEWPSGFPPNNGTAWTVFVRTRVNSISDSGSGGSNRERHLVWLASNKIDLYAFPNSSGLLVSFFDSTDHTGSVALSLSGHSWAITEKASGDASVAYSDGVSFTSGTNFHGFGVGLYFGWTESDNADDATAADFSDIRLWSVALTGTQVAAEDASLSPVATSNLAAWWPLDHDFHDASGNGAPDIVGVGGFFNTRAQGTGTLLQASL